MQLSLIILLLASAQGLARENLTANAYAQTSWKNKVNSLAQQHLDQGLGVGIVIGVIKEGQTWTATYGHKSTSDLTALTDDTGFEIGSISKVFTGLALGELVTRDRVKLGDTLSRFLPDLAGLPAGQITLHELTTHTSGLPRIPTNLRITDPKNPYKDYTLQDLLEFLTLFKFENPREPFIPATYNYSNIGAGLLGSILAGLWTDPNQESPPVNTPLVNSKGYEQLIRSIITDPLAMPNTGIELSPIQSSRMAQGHDPILDPTSNWDIPALAGAGAIRSTLTDMMTFLRANLAPDTTQLSAAIKLSHQIHGTMDPSTNVGLGWHMSGSKDNPEVWHNGQTGGFHSLIAFQPQSQTGLVVLSNSAMPVECVFATVFDKPCEQKKEYIHTDTQLHSYTGIYEISDPALILEITKRGGFLIADIKRQSKFRLKAFDQGKFDLGSGLATITFITDASGSVNSLTLSQDAIDYTALRVRPVTSAD